MEITTEVESVENEQTVDRVKLKEERKLRNKQKKIAKKLLKQKEKEQKELILKLQVKSNNVTLITRDLADKVVGNTVGTGSSDHKTVSDTDFPVLGARPKVNMMKRDVISTTTDIEKKSISKLELSDFLNVPTPSKHIRPIPQTVENYNGNPLDSDMPTRKRGKYREEPKMKKLSKLKREIIKDKDENDTEELQKIPLQSTNLCDNIITEELNDLVTNFISAVVGLQEKLYKRDSIKGKSKRRYVVGLHEVKKYLNLNKVKILVLAPDINLTKYDGAINCAIKEIIDLAKMNNIPYLVALKRRSLAALTMKRIPVSCIAVLNYEGLEDQYSNIIKFLLSVKKDNTPKSNTEYEANKKFLNKLMEALKCNT